MQEYYTDVQEVMTIKDSVDEKVRAATEELKLKLEKKEIDDDKMDEKYAKYGRKIQKKKIRNKKKRTKIDI